MDIKDLVFLEDGTIIENKSYGIYVIGHSSEVSTWVKVWESSRYSVNDLKDLKDIVNKVWNKIPTPMFEVVYRREYTNNTLDIIRELKEFSGLEGVQVTSDDVTFTTNNPFVLSSEDEERTQAALDKYKQQSDALWAIKDAHHKAVGKEILEAVRAYVKDNSSTFLLVEKVYKDEVSIHFSKISILANGVEITQVKLMDFVKQVFPDLWEKYNSI